MTFSSHEGYDRFTGELATVIGALSDGFAAAGIGTTPPEGGWVVTMQGEQGVRGSLVVEFDRNATEALVKKIVGMDFEPPAEVVIDTLKEMCAQAVGSMVQNPPLVGSRFAITSVDRATGSAGPGAMLCQIAVEGVAGLAIRIWGDLSLASAVAEPEPPAPSPVASNPKLGLILDIDLPLMVRFGRTEMPLRALTTLGPGSVIDLGRSPDDPVDVMVSNQVIARGEVVVVGGNYGVRITDVVSPADRIRSVEVDW